LLENNSFFMTRVILLILTIFTFDVLSAQEDTSKVSFDVDDTTQKRLLAEKYISLAIDYSMEDNMDSTLEYLFLTLNIYQELEKQKNCVAILTDIAITFSNYDMLSESFEYLQRAVDICTEIRDSTALARIYYILGLANINLNAFDIANSYLQKSAEYYKNLGEMFDYNLAKVAIEKNNFNIARSRSLDEMIKANFEQDRVIKGFHPSENMIIDYLNYCYSFVSDFYYVLVRLKDNRLKTYYLETMRDFYNLAKKYDGYTTMLDSRKITAKILIFLAEGNLSKAKAELNKIVDKDDPDYYEASYAYHKACGNYQEALHYFEAMEMEEKKYFDAETSIKYERKQTQKEYENFLKLKEMKLRYQQYYYNQEQHRVEIRRSFFLAILVLAILILTFLTILGVHQIHVSNKLETTNKEILKFNADLVAKNQDITNQKIALMNIKEQIEVNNYDLKKLNKSLSESLLWGRDIQIASMPDLDTMNSVFGECFVFWKPKNIVSGDFYWISESQTKKYLVTADCTGHGVPGALLSMFGMSIFSDVVPFFPDLNAAEILNIVKDRFVKTLSQDTPLDDGMELSLVIFSKEKPIIEYAGAKRPLYIVRNYEIIKYSPDLLSIGHNIGRENVKFTNHVIPVEKGDMLYTFSDGIPDQMGGISGVEKFSLPMLRELLKEISSMTAQQQYRVLSAAIESHTLGSEQKSVAQTDDQLMIGIRI